MFSVNPFVSSGKTCFRGVSVSLEVLIHWESREYILRAFAVVMNTLTVQALLSNLTEISIR
jgi:hypothetical protein